MISAAQCRAARGLLNWSQGNLVRECGLSAVTIRAFERGGEMRESNQNLLVLTFERAGVDFIPENGGGAGVRLKKTIRRAPGIDAEGNSPGWTSDPEEADRKPR